MKKAAIYVRVSTASKSEPGGAVNFLQNSQLQEQPLRDLISQRSWDVYRAYSDRACGAKERRAGLDALMEDARRGLFDVVVFWSCERFARSIKQLVLALEELRRLGIDFVSYQEGLDTTDPMGTTICTLVAAISEVERSGVHGRNIPSMDARARGSKSGKSAGRRRKIVPLDTVLELRDAGFSWRKIATIVGAGVTTIRRAVQQTYKFQLTVTDSNGATSTDSVTVNYMGN